MNGAINTWSTYYWSAHYLDISDRFWGFWIHSYNLASFVNRGSWFPSLGYYRNTFISHDGYLGYLFPYLISTEETVSEIEREDEREDSKVEDRLETTKVEREDSEIGDGLPETMKIERKDNKVDDRSMITNKYTEEFTESYGYVARNTPWPLHNESESKRKDGKVLDTSITENSNETTIVSTPYEPKFEWQNNVNSLTLTSDMNMPMLGRRIDSNEDYHWELMIRFGIDLIFKKYTPHIFKPDILNNTFVPKLSIESKIIIKAIMIHYRQILKGEKPYSFYKITKNLLGSELPMRTKEPFFVHEKLDAWMFRDSTDKDVLFGMTSKSDLIIELKNWESFDNMDGFRFTERLNLIPQHLIWIWNRFTLWNGGNQDQCDQFWLLLQGIWIKIWMDLMRTHISYFERYASIMESGGNDTLDPCFSELDEYRESFASDGIDPRFLVRVLMNRASDNWKEFFVNNSLDRLNKKIIREFESVNQCKHWPAKGINMIPYNENIFDISGLNPGLDIRREVKMKFYQFESVDFTQFTVKSSGSKFLDMSSRQSGIQVKGFVINDRGDFEWEKMVPGTIQDKSEDNTNEGDNDVGYYF